MVDQRADRRVATEEAAGGRDLAAVGLNSEPDTGRDRRAIHQDRAGSAHAFAAPFLHRHIVELVVEKLLERRVRRHLAVDAAAVPDDAKRQTRRALILHWRTSAVSTRRTPSARRRRRDPSAGKCST